MRLLWITHSSLGINGTLCQTASRGTIKALRDKGWAVEVVSTASNDSANEETIDGFRWYKISNNFPRGLQSILLEKAFKNCVKSLLSKREFDLVIVNWSVCRGIIPLVKNKGIPIIVDDRSPPVHEDLLGRMQWIHYRYCWKSASRGADGFSFNSNELRKMICEKYTISKPVCVYPSAVEVEKFEKTEFREIPTIVYHGLLDRERGVWSIVRACDKLIERGLEIRLLMFGEGNDWQRLEKSTSHREWFELMPRCEKEEVPRRLSRAQIGVIPLPDKYQWRFSSPLKLFEYAAAGLNVIATDIPCHVAIGERSWLTLVDDNNASITIADAIAEIIDSEQWEEKSKDARRDALAEFSWDRSVESLHGLCQKVVSRHVGVENG